MTDLYAKIIAEEHILNFVHESIKNDWHDNDSDIECADIDGLFAIDYGYFDDKYTLGKFIHALASLNVNIKVQVEIYISDSDLDDAFDWYVLTHDPESDKANISRTLYHEYMPKPSKVVELQNQPEALNTYLKELEVVRNNLFSSDSENISLSHEHMLTLSLTK